MIQKLLFIITIITCSVYAKPRLRFTSVEALRTRYGTEGIALGECGTAFSSELSSVFYNPANATFYASRNSVNFAYSLGYEKILPTPYHINDIHNKNFTASFFLPDLLGDFSFSVLYALNHETSDTIENDPTGKLDALYAIPNKERVSNLSISSSWRDIISVGISFKPFYSKFNDTGDETRGIAWDFGLRGQYRFEMGNRAYILPGFGLALNNIGDSATYTNFVSGDPIPKTFRSGFSLEGGITDVVWLASMVDTRKLIADSTDQWALPSIGFQLGITPLLQLNYGMLFDDIHHRDAIHWGITTGYRHQQFNSFLDFITKRKKKEISRNFQILYSISMIHVTDFTPTDDLQHSHQLSVAFSLKNF